MYQGQNHLKRMTAHLKRNPFNRGAQEQVVSAKKVYKKTCKEAESQNRKVLLDKLLNADDPKDFWRKMKNMQGYGRENEDPSSCIPPSTWEEYFKGLLNTKKETTEPPYKRARETTNTNTDVVNTSNVNNHDNTQCHRLMQAKIKMDELKDVIKRMKLGKSNGPDNVISEYLRYATNNVLKALLELLNAIFAHARYPSSWSNNYLKALYKKGAADDPGNYRGLAIGSVLAKLYSTILLNRIEIYATTTGIISINQIGFIKGCRTADHIYLLKTLITKYTRNRGRLFAAFIDFKKAYDTVNRDTLLKNLKGPGTKLRHVLWKGCPGIGETAGAAVAYHFGLQAGPVQ